MLLICLHVPLFFNLTLNFRRQLIRQTCNSDLGEDVPPAPTPPSGKSDFNDPRVTPLICKTMNPSMYTETYLTNREKIFPRVGHRMTTNQNDRRIHLGKVFPVRAMPLVLVSWRPKGNK